MNNNVVLGVVFWFQRLKVTTLRFDFCGSQIGRGHRQGAFLRPYGYFERGTLSQHILDFIR